MTIQLEITAVTNSGDGVGRHEGKVVFVPLTAPGDIAEVVIVEAKKKFSRGRLHKIIEPSPHRTQPQCSYFGTCGGCDWQHMDYETQLHWKHRHVAETLSRIGGLAPEVLLPIVASPLPFGYRNRVRGTFRKGKFFFHKKKSQDKVRIESCSIASPEINKALSNIPTGLENQSLELRLTGDELHFLKVSQSRSTELGFQQVNTEVHKLLMAAMLERIQLSGEPHKIVDLYCGKGEWTKKMAQTFPNAQVIGVDSLPENIHRAKEGSGPSNVDFTLAFAEEWIQKADLSQTFITVDPPRAGLDPEVVSALIEAQPLGLLYVSCHQATLARDLKALCETAFEIESVQAFDMFPQTSHTEALAALRCKSP